MGPAGIAGHRPGDRRGEDDPAAVALLERRQAGLHRDEGALEVGAENLVPFLRRHRLELRLREDAGIGAEDVETAVALDGGGGGRFHRRKIADVGGESRSLAARLAEFAGGRLGRVDVPGNDQHPGAVPGKDPRDALADPLARPGDDGRLAVKRREHCLLPRWFPPPPPAAGGSAPA